MRDEFITIDGVIIDVRKVASVAKGFGTVTFKAKKLREALERGMEPEEAILTLLDTK